MLKAEYKAKQLYDPEYKLSGDDGVHPGWSGHLVMAYTFLKAMGLDGNIGTITADLGTDKATATEGHSITKTNLSDKTLAVTVNSSRYPYCDIGPVNEFTSVRSGMTLVPFNQELNRFTLKTAKLLCRQLFSQMGRNN